MNNINQAMKSFEDKLREALSSQKYPSDKIEPGFSSIAMIALGNHSIMSIGCDVPTYHAMLANLDPGTVSDWNLYDISFAINTIEKSSPNELRATVEQYGKIVESTRKMAAVWNAMVEPIRQGLTKVEPAKNGKGVIQMGARKANYKGKR